MPTQPNIPSPSQPLDQGRRSGWRWLYWLVLAFVVWRFGCFVWLPLNLQELPGALFEASAFAGTSLVVAWMVLGDGPGWRRVIKAGAILVCLRAATFAGLFAHHVRNSLSSNDIVIFRYVEDQTLVATLILCLLVRIATNLRLTMATQGDLACLPPKHVSLRQLFVLTAIIACALGARQAATLIWGEGIDGAIHAIITAHVVAIVLGSLITLMLLLGSVSRWTAVFLVGFLIALPFAICGYFLNGFGPRMENWVHFSTAVVGPVITALITVAAGRAAGIRLRVVTRPVPRAWPSSLPSEIFKLL